MVCGECEEMRDGFRCSGILNRVAVKRPRRGGGEGGLCWMLEKTYQRTALMLSVRSWGGGRYVSEMAGSVWPCGGAHSLRCTLDPGVAQAWLHCLAADG